MKNSMKVWFVAIALVAFASACSHGSKVKFDKGAVQASTEASGAPGLTGVLNWVKNKKNSMDIQVTLENHYDFPVHFNVGAWTATVNGASSVARSQNFTGTIPGGATDTQLVKFTFAGVKSLEGEGTIVLSGITTDDSGHKIGALTMNFTSK